ncbi:nischarin-like [Ornithodoros turicata]|uniref:nischarin-like n=1 Tax=Ornithodoros turicata TaxID=34597 RepID=UPI003139A84E
MALFRPVQSWLKASETVKITGREQGDGFTAYIIQVSVPPYRWTVKHRYNDFREVNEKLTSSHHVAKSLLPPKKLFGNQSEAFIQQRQSELELYLQSLVHQFSVPPPVLGQFLDFHRYEVHTILDDLAERLFDEGESLLAKDEEFHMTPLVLHCLTERLKLAEPTCVSKNKRRDLAHILDFVSQLRKLYITGTSTPVGTSNICPSMLAFDLSPFKALQSLHIRGCEIQGRISGFEVVGPGLLEMEVHQSLQNLRPLLLANHLNYDVAAAVPWSSTVRADLSNNAIHQIDPAIRVLASVEYLDLSNNQIEELENLEPLPRLSDLNLSNNRIGRLVALHTRLGNIRCLRLSGNHIESLAGLSRLYSLVDLDLSHNQVTLISEVGHLGSLPCLEKVDLSHNPVTYVVDYRPHALLAFGARAAEIALDCKKPTPKELDTVAVLRALKVAKEGQIMRHGMTDRGGWGDPGVQLPSSGTWSVEASKVKEGGCPTLPCEEIVEDPAVSEFRKQLAALRHIGGNNWLRLLNQLQNDKPSEYSTEEGSTYQSEIHLTPPQEDIPHPCSLSGTTAELILPEWLSALKSGNPAFLDMLQSLSHGNPPFWASWCMLLSRDSSCIPACVVGTCLGLHVYRILKLPSPDFSALPEMESTSVFAPSSMVALLAGPRHSYVELQIGSETGLESRMFLSSTPSDASDLLVRVGTTFGVEVRQKFAAGEMESCALEAATKVGVVPSQVAFCERVLVEDAVCGKGVVHYGVVTPPCVVIVQESVFGGNVVFSAKQVFLAMQSVDDVHMWEEMLIQTQSDGPDDVIQDLGKCGHGLKMHLANDGNFAVRFLTRDSRSRFLTAFMSARQV